MQSDLRAEYERIGKERDEAGRASDRERFRFFVRIAVISWIWVIIGGALMAKGLNIDATVGPFYFPGLMARAEALFKGGLFIGTAGPLLTIIFGMRMGNNRGYLD
jgi:hypothetical protein